MQNIRQQFEIKLIDLFEPSSIPLIAQLQYLTNMKNMDSILEIGPGSGSIYPTTIINKKKTAKYTVIDIEENYLQIGKNRIENIANNTDNDILEIPTLNEGENKDFSYFNQQLNVELINMSADELKFESHTFDGCFASHSLHHTDWDKSIPEIYRVLKPGGKIGIVEMQPKPTVFLPKNEEVEKIIYQLYGETYDLYKQRFQDQMGKRKHSHAFLTPQELKEKLQKYQFKNIQQYSQYVPIQVDQQNCLNNYLIGNQEDLVLQVDENQEKQLNLQIYNIYLKQFELQPHGFIAQGLIAIKN